MKIELATRAAFDLMIDSKFDMNDSKKLRNLIFDLISVLDLAAITIFDSIAFLMMIVIFFASSSSLIIFHSVHISRIISSFDWISDSKYDSIDFEFELKLIVNFSNLNDSENLLDVIFEFYLKIITTFCFIVFWVATAAFFASNFSR